MIRDDQGAILLQNLVSSRGDWSVGCLANDLGLHLVCIALVDHFLHGGRHKNVSLLKHYILASVGLSTRESHNGAMLNLPVLQCLGVDAIGVPDGAIPLSNSNAGGASPSEIPAGVKAHVAKALHNVGLAGPARSLPNHRHEMSLIDEVLKAMEDTAACGASPAVDAALVDGLASDTGAGVHVGVPNSVGVSVSNPGHLPLTLDNCSLSGCTSSVSDATPIFLSIARFFCNVEANRAAASLGYLCLLERVAPIASYSFSRSSGVTSPGTSSALPWEPNTVISPCLNPSRSTCLYLAMASSFCSSVASDSESAAAILASRSASNSSTTSSMGTGMVCLLRSVFKLFKL